MKNDDPLMRLTLLHRKTMNHRVDQEDLDYQDFLAVLVFLHLLEVLCFLEDLAGLVNLEIRLVLVGLITKVIINYLIKSS